MRTVGDALGGTENAHEIEADSDDTGGGEFGGVDRAGEGPDPAVGTRFLEGEAEVKALQAHHGTTGAENGDGALGIEKNLPDRAADGRNEEGENEPPPSAEFMNDDSKKPEEEHVP